MLDSVRVRLALWYVSVLAIVLIAFSIAVYILIAQTLRERLDADLHQSLESAAVTLVNEVAAGKDDSNAAADALNELSTLDSSAVFKVDGALVAEQPAQGNIHVSLPEREGTSTDPYFGTIDSPNGERRIIAQRITVPSRPSPYTIVISRSFASVETGLKRIRRILMFAIPGALLFSAAGGWFLSRRSLASVVSMSDRARRISAENLSQRLPVVNPRDELGRLAATFNELLARLDASFTQQRRFMADASHELRTPLSVIRTSTDVTLERKHRAEGEYRDALRIIDEQTRRLSHIVEDMFTLARADVGRRNLNVTDFYLDEILLEASRAAGILGARKNVAVEVTGTEETVYHGDEGLLRQMVLNLLDNAVKYTLPGGFVKVGLKHENSHYDIIVTDSGVGIPKEEQALIFERFYRVDKARTGSETSTSWGSGLGLSIARWIAEAHHGQLFLERSGSNGSTFVIRLPEQNAG
jgi:heavy metal sensor kinase